MVVGELGAPGQHVPPNVEEERGPGPGAVIILLQPMAEINAQEQETRRRSATLILVRLTKVSRQRYNIVTYTYILFVYLVPSRF